jgi:hypothetical protein
MPWLASLVSLNPAEELPHGTAWRPVEAFRKAAVDSGNCVDVPMRLTKYQLRKEAELQVRKWNQEYYVVSVVLHTPDSGRVAVGKIIASFANFERYHKRVLFTPIHRLFHQGKPGTAFAFNIGCASATGKALNVGVGTYLQLCHLAQFTRQPPYLLLSFSCAAGTTPNLTPHLCQEEGGHMGSLFCLSASLQSWHYYNFAN